MSRSLFARLHARFGPGRVDAASRRDFLKASLAASAGLLLSDQVARGQAAKTGKRVLVIGAGFAGLAGAHELQASGYDVSVVEASPRIGGRVLSFGDFVEGKNCEGGGELIGSNHLAWVNYAKKFELEFLDVSESPDEWSFPIMLGGKVLDNEEAAKLYEDMDAAFNTMNKDAEPINALAPWASPDAAALDRKTTQQWIDGLKCSATCKQAIAAQFAADNGVDCPMQSYLGNLAVCKAGGLEKYWTDSEVYRCKGGNQQLAAKLAAAVGKDRIQVDLAVKKIEITATGTKVTCDDGRTIERDDVVLAVPPSVWNKIEFSPGLPAALGKIQAGSNVKYLAALKGKFWREKKIAPDSLTDGFASMTWDGTDGQDQGPGAVMVAFSGGSGSEKALALDAQTRDKVYGEELEKMYPGFKENFVKARFMNWPKMRWTMMGYSFPAPGEVTVAGPALQQGVGGRLHFAGEHSCYGFVGFMEGALQSGIAAAKKLAVRDGVLAK